MAQLASTSTAVSFSMPRPYSFPSHQQSWLYFNFSVKSKNRGCQRFFCQINNPDPVNTGTEEEKRSVEAKAEISENPANGAATKSNASTSPVLPDYPDKSFNRRIAVGATLVAFGLFLSKRLDFGVSLKDLTAAAMPYEEALSNGKPTVVEFYADWCEVCRELVPDVYQVEQKYKDQVNFVMLNVDNTKWEQELDEFGVEGIPHFAFLDREGNEEGNVVGRLPRQYLLENVDALARGEATVPHARVVGQYSSAENRKARPVVDPRSHG